MDHAFKVAPGKQVRLADYDPDANGGMSKEEGLAKLAKLTAEVKSWGYTGALELVLACDLLVAAESARFADTHGRWGMTPTWGMSQRLPRRIGPVRAKQMMFSGTPITAAEAVVLGLANSCVADGDLPTRGQGEWRARKALWDRPWRGR